MFWGRLVPSEDEPCGNVMRKAALHLLRKTPAPEKRFSVQRKMFRATFSDDFLYHALFGQVK
jgi:hypothetical protein